MLLKFKGTLALLVVLLSISSIMAQDEATDVPGDIVGTYIINVQSGTFEATDTENVFELSIVGLEDTITWVFHEPAFRAGQINKAFMTLDWAAAESLPSATAILSTEDEIITLSLRSPLMGEDYNTITYVAEVLDLVPLYEVNAKSTASIPDAFGIGTLAIETNAEFEAALLDGAITRLATLREVSATRTCVPGRNCPENDPLYRGNTSNADDDTDTDTDAATTDETDNTTPTPDPNTDADNNDGSSS